ncbi:MAG: hypothetical protein HY514_04720 [Candidatus Aenigmarchaeota archaeon]|nr:hypothetical protein [Candidatus Aenigmarchaeota archaeon]
MSDFKCGECERNFSSQESLDQHNMDKHGPRGTHSKHELKQFKKQEREKQLDIEKKKASRSKLLKRSAYVAVPVLLIAAVFAFISSQPLATGNAIGSVTSGSEIPNTPIHWHPTLTIKLNGQQQTIPANLGAVGVHQPIHTHDSTGVLHYENDNPTPENMPLRYFFEKVWRKPFNSTCIMNYCNSDSSTVKMFVNGMENSEFDNYIPRDRDEIRIEFN